MHVAAVTTCDRGQDIYRCAQFQVEYCCQDISESAWDTSYSHQDLQDSFTVALLRA